MKEPLLVLQRVAGWGCATFSAILAGFVFIKDSEPSGVDAVPILIALVVICGLIWFFVPGKLKQKEKAATGATVARTAAAVAATVTEPPGPTFTLAGQKLARPQPPSSSPPPPSVARRRGPSLPLRAFHESGERFGETTAKAVAGLVGKVRRNG
jgi:hypothetical protein